MLVRYPCSVCGHALPPQGDSTLLAIGSRNRQTLGSIRKRKRKRERVKEGGREKERERERESAREKERARESHARVEESVGPSQGNGTHVNFLKNRPEFEILSKVEAGS